MKSLMIGLLGFAAIISAVWGTIWVFKSIGFSSDTISTIMMVGVLLFIAKPFGELTQSILTRK